MSKRKKGQDDPLKTCVFCRSDEQDEIMLGKFVIVKYPVHCHLNCLFLSSGLTQNGEINDDGTWDGVYGFLNEDIKKELQRATRIKCKFCSKKGASIGCCVPQCRMTFHLPCGLKNNSLHQFYGTFSSYCKDHRPFQRDINKIPDKSCSICLEPKDYYGELKYHTVKMPCCKKLLHRRCLQQHAFNAGIHFFKCPLCNDKNKFLKEMQKFGINVPDQDATWEIGDAFSDLYDNRIQCDANDVCLCPEGALFQGYASSTFWKLIRCITCASKGTHTKCGKVNKETERKWTCDDCEQVLKKLSK